MSQMGKFSGGILGIPINTITGNVGGAVSPDAFSNVDLLGSTPVTVTGNPAAWTLTITVDSATTTSEGIIELATDAEVVAGADTTRAVVPSSLVAKLGVMTANAIPYGAGTAAALSWTAAGITGQVLKANTGVAPSWGQVDLTTDVTGILPVANGGTGVNSLVVGNTIYVTKNGNDANVGTDINHAFLTIQAAVTAAVAGDTILVYPGIYTETITHTADDVSVFGMGDFTNCVIQNANANVIDFNTRTNIVYKFFTIQVTAASTAINTIQGSTGSCSFLDCFLRMVCAADIVAATQPAVINVSGAGSANIRLGSLDYLHTGNCGGTALKSALIVGTGGLISVYRNSDCNVTCSGTALATSLAIDLAATGNINVYTSDVNVTDPDAGIVSGLGYLGGVGVYHEYYRNNVHVVVGAANIGYGFYAGDSASTSRFFYNHIDVTDAGGTSYSYYIGAAATVISHFDDIVAADGINLDPTGFYYEVSSESNGDLSLLGPSAAATRALTVANTDNTATASSSGVEISVGGATSTGDPYVNFLVTGAGTYSMGIDNTVAGDPFKITSGATPSAGTDLFTMTSTGVITLNNALDVTEGGTGVATLTSHGVLLGSGAGDISATAVGATNQVLLGNTGADPTWGQVDLTTDVTGTLPAGNGGTGLANITNYSLIVGSGAGAATELGVATNGQLPIGSTGADPVLATITAGANITVTNGAGSIQIDATGGIAWNEETGASATMAVDNGYIANNAGQVDLTLPDTAALGSVIRVCGKGAGGWKISQNAGESIIWDESNSTTVGVGGSIESTDDYDSIEILCTVADTTWTVLSSKGNLTIT